MFEKARRFVYQNARPLDLARWQFHFENGSREAVLTALAAYQNPDGGFGCALEPDNWNPDSNPIATWTATRLLREIKFTDGAHPIMVGILKYLASGKDFLDGKWCNTVPGSNAHPHAIWWACDSAEGLPCDNPSASLFGFALRFGERESSLYEAACRYAENLIRNFPEDAEMHTLNNYIDFLAYCEETALFDLSDFRRRLYDLIRAQVCPEPEKWYTEYVSKPSFFFDRTPRLFEIIPGELCRQDARLIKQHQNPDGSWPITWKWWTDYPEFEVSANWWRSAMIITNLLYLKFLGGTV